MSTISNIEQLEAIYGTPAETSLIKVTRVVTPDYLAFINASPFLTLATCGPNGVDCSPRGDRPGFVRVVDDRTLQIPDRRGNNRIDSLRNIVHDSRIALLFFVPGSGTTLRVNAHATISADRELCESFAMEEKQPRTVIVARVDEVYFQCARAIVRADLWNPSSWSESSNLPTPGQILANLSDQRVGGDAYDCEWPERARKTLW